MKKHRPTFLLLLILLGGCVSVVDGGSEEGTIGALEGADMSCRADLGCRRPDDGGNRNPDFGGQDPRDGGGGGGPPDLAGTAQPLGAPCGHTVVCEHGLVCNALGVCAPLGGATCKQISDCVDACGETAVCDDGCRSTGSIATSDQFYAFSACATGVCLAVCVRNNLALLVDDAACEACLGDARRSDGQCAAVVNACFGL